MKRNIIIIALPIFFCLSNITKAQVPTNGLIAWYPFNGNALDFSGNNNNGIVNNATLTTDRFGRANNAYSFDGISSNIDLGINNAINSILGDFSFSYWAYANASGCILSSYSNQGGSNWRIISRFNGSDNPFAVNTDFLAGTTLSWQTTTTPANSINYNQWYNIVYVRNGVTAKIYINGTLSVTTSVSSDNINNPTSPPATTKLGYNFAPVGGEYFNGKLDDIIIYNRALSPTEVQQLYNLTPAQTVTDIDGNVYNTVTIGTQIWMKENLKTSHYRNGDSIPTGLSDAAWSATTSGAYAIYENDAANNTTYGKLYNWYAAVNDPRGLAPAGWHVPSDAEWTTLTNYLTNNGYGYEGSGNDIGKSIAATSGWTLNSTAGNVGNDQTSNNNSGFSALPGAARAYNGGFSGLGQSAWFWSASDGDASIIAYDRHLFYDYDLVYRGYGYKSTGMYIRCVRDPTPYQLPYSTATNAIKPNGNQLTVAEPIQLGTGTYSYKHTDLNIPIINGTLNFTRFYNSLNGNVQGPLGYGWSHTYNYYLENKQDNAWNIHYPDGHVSTFIPMNNSGQSFPVFSGTTDSVQKNNNKSYSLFTKEKQEYHFDSTGKLDSIIDLNNNITKLYYTGNALDSVVAPGGRSLVITYSGNTITSVKDPLNRTCNYSYDANNNLITVQDANTGTASFTYDSVHQMLTAVNPLGYTIVNNTYDSMSKVVTQKDVYNQVTSIVYNYPDSGDATVTNPDTSQIVAHHDNYIRKTSEKDELGFTKTYAYDANSNENEFTNENNQSETRLFDNDGNELADTLPGSKITHISYNSFNSPVQETDAKNNQKIFYYNPINNNLDSIRNADNSLQFFYYNTNGQVIQSVDGNGNATTYTYSPAGDLLSSKTFAGIKQFAYDPAGRKVSETDENGHTTKYVYDNNDNVTKITDPLGRTIVNTYDANNQLFSVKDKKGFITTYTYDKKGRKTKSTNPKGGVTTYTYDVRDNLKSVTDPDNNTVSYIYDKKGRKTSATNALGTTQYQYDGVGNLIKVIDPTNKTTEYTYTATNKKHSQKDGLGNTSSYAINNPVSIFDYTGLYGDQDNGGLTNFITVLDGLQQFLERFNFSDNSANIGVAGVGYEIGLYNLYKNATTSMNAFQNKTIGTSGLLVDFILATLDVKGGSSYDFKYEAQKTTNDYINGNTDLITAWGNLFNGGVNALPTGVGFVNKYVSPMIMEGTSYGLDSLVNYLGDKIYQLTGY